MGFLNLPNEVILLLIPHLDYENEINALCRTTRWLHELLNPILYKRSLTQRNGGYTLERAAIHGSVSTGRLILEAGAPPDACGGKPWQPFALAALHGHSEIIGLLYEYGVDPCSTDNDWKNHLDDEEDHEDWKEGHPLSMAASYGHVSVVNLLLKYGVHPDLPTGKYEKRTALHLAAENGHLDVVRVLADAGSLINAQNRYGTTPLAFAARENQLKIVQFLLSRGADPNITTKNEGTSLCMASHSGNIDIVRCLLDHGATPNPSYPDGQKPLFQLSCAAEGGHDHIVNLLLSRFDYIKSSTEPYQQAVLLCVAALTGRTTLLTTLLTEHNYDPNLRVTDGRMFFPYYKFYNPTPKTALTWAAECNQPVAINILLSHGASITPPIDESPNDDSTNNDIPALLRAIEKGHQEAVAALLAHGANPNNPPGKALAAAVTNPPIFSLLLANNADPTIPPTNSSLLFHTLYYGNIDTLRILLDHPKGPELVVDPVPSESGLTGIPLFRLAIWGREEVLHLLLDRGLLTSLKDPLDHTGEDSLIRAAPHGGIPLVRLLLDIGFTIRGGDNTGYLINRSATAKEDPEGLLDFLLQNGCSIDDRDRAGRTALWLAAYEGNQGGMRRLLERGADPNVVCQGETALSVAARKKHVGAVEVILGVFDERGLDLGLVERLLKRAEEEEEDRRANSKADIVRVLRRFYWPRRYPVSTT
ncbi:ankyrin repeat-containing domain protein [Aspergillus cavernicola]|uniref:Ankyrin repeat-containing domain protein n=1 Tax=Aspergillus cavernicola TaxID=176166 RepID=A0ABR4HZR2_9EURO